MNILFIGNSFTYYNEMPKMLEKMCQANGYKVHIEHITYGGYSLIQYLEVKSKVSKRIYDKLKEIKWDYVVLQEQSSKADVNKTEFLSSVDRLNKLIISNDAKTILYSTWAYKAGSDKLTSTGYSFDEFHNSLTSAYIDAEKIFKVLRAPVGTVFSKICKEEATINLYDDDNFHPSLVGSYVVAYTFYTLLFGFQNNEGIVENGISLTLVETIRKYVLETFNELQ